MSAAQIILEYLKVFLSPSGVAAMLGVVVLLLFRNGIRDLLARIGTIRIAGNEFSTIQAERTKEENNEKTIPMQSEAVSKVELPENLNSQSPDVVKNIIDLIKSERARAALWEYRYLNYFFALHTQHILDWFINLKTSTTYSMYDAFWSPLIPNARERNTVISVLANHHLIDLNDVMISVTPKGQEYVEWRGAIPNKT